MIGLLACVGEPEGKDTAPVDSETATDPADSAPDDTGTPTETGDPVPGMLHADVVWHDVASTVECDATSGDTFVRTFDDALGNVAGRVTCTGAGGDTVLIQFTTGTTGTWTDPEGGADFTWTRASGERLAWGEPGTVTTNWSLSFTRFDRVDTQTIELEGSFAGSWTDESGGSLGSITGYFETPLACTNCP